MLASSAEPVTSTVKPVSPSLDFRIPDRRPSSSITRRRNDSPPTKVWGTQVPPQGRPKFKTALKDPREAFGDHVPSEERNKWRQERFRSFCWSRRSAFWVRRLSPLGL